jgi:hypothetical protein
MLDPDFLLYEDTLIIRPTIGQQRIRFLLSTGNLRSDLMHNSCMKDHTICTATLLWYRLSRHTGLLSMTAANHTFTMRN